MDPITRLSESKSNSDPSKPLSEGAALDRGYRRAESLYGTEFF